MKLPIKAVNGIATTLVLALGMAVPVSAHVVVRPSEATTGTYQTFTVSAPNEKEQAFVGVKLLIPENVQSVTPTNKPGWTISMDKTGEGETAKVTAITWSDGSVEPGLRDEFTFSAKTPDMASDLEWKAYQTYADGTVVSWDQKEEAHTDTDSDDAASGPLSVTKVTAETDAVTNEQASADELKSTKRTAQFALYTAIAALVITLVAIAYAVKK
jgi:uncharacterized protein YcnI